MPLTFDERNNLECGNLLISIGEYEDKKAEAQGHEFLGAAKDANGAEVHVFRMAKLNHEHAQIDLQRSYGITFQLATLPPSALHNVPTELAIQIRAAKALHPDVADAAVSLENESSCQKQI